MTSVFVVIRMLPAIIVNRSLINHPITQIFLQSMPDYTVLLLCKSWSHAWWFL